MSKNKASQKNHLTCKISNVLIHRRIFKLIDYLVSQGYYLNRSEFTRHAIANYLMNRINLLPAEESWIHFPDKDKISIFQKDGSIMTYILKKKGDLSNVAKTV